MKRPKATLVRLPADTLEDLRNIALRRKTSMAQLVKDAVEQTYHIGAGAREIDPKKDPIYKIVGAGRSKRKDGEETHDRDIYGLDL